MRIWVDSAQDRDYLLIERSGDNPLSIFTARAIHQIVALFGTNVSVVFSNKSFAWLSSMRVITEAMASCVTGFLDCFPFILDSLL